MKLKTLLKRIFYNFDFISYPIILVVGGVFIVFYFPYHFVPDCLDLKNYNKIYELFNLIITSLVSLIGIYITVSLVAYEFFKQKSGIDFHKSFLINKLNAYFISFTVLTILCTFISSIIISTNQPNDKEVSVIYFNAFLFIGVIISLFPVAFNLFSSLRPEKIANEEILKINNGSIFIKVSENSDIDEQTENFENDSLYRVENVVIALIAVKDVLIARAIIQKASRRLSNLIIEEKDDEDKKYMTERLIAFQIRIIDFSLSEPNNSTILKSIWFVVEDMYNSLIKRKESVQHFRSYHKEFFDRFFNRLFRSNNEEIIIEGIKSLRQIIQNQVLFNLDKELKGPSIDHLRKSIDPTFEPNDNYTNEDYSNAHHFEGIAHDLIDCFFSIINKAIIAKQPEIINKCYKELNELNFKFELEKVRVDIQSYFYLKTFKSIYSYTYEAYEKGVFNDGHDATNLTPALFEELILKNHPVAREILVKYCYLLIDLQKINKLDRWFLGGLTIGDFMTIPGELGGIAKRCAIKYKDGQAIQNCLQDCVNTFEILKDYYEANPPDDFGLYLNIKVQFENILYWLKREGLYRSKIYKDIKLIIASFKDKKEIN